VPNRRKTFAALAEKTGGTDYQANHHDWKKRNQLWQARIDALLADLACVRRCKRLRTDVLRPDSRLADAGRAANAKAAELEIWSPHSWATSGDGNFSRVAAVGLWKNAGRSPAPKLLSGWLNEMANFDEGTVYGRRHGIGQGKRPYLVKELAPRSMSWGRSNGRWTPTNI